MRRQGNGVEGGSVTGRYLRRGAIIDTLKSEERTNAIQNRAGTRHPVRVTVCGCPDPKCGAWHTILDDRTLPTAEEAVATLQARKATSTVRKRPKG